MKYQVRVQMKMGTVLLTEPQDIPNNDVNAQQKIVLNNFMTDKRCLYLGKLQNSTGYVAVNPDAVAYHSFEVLEEADTQSEASETIKE